LKWLHHCFGGGQEVGAMHACGHDLHMTNMLRVARVMAADTPCPTRQSACNKKT